MAFEYEVRDMLEEIRVADETGKIILNDWEVDFIDGVFDNFKWTGAQKERIELLHNRIDV